MAAQFNVLCVNVLFLGLTFGEAPRSTCCIDVGYLPLSWLFALCLPYFFGVAFLFIIPPEVGSFYVSQSPLFR